MIKQYRGFEAKRSTTREMLPAGGYVAKITDTELINYTWGDVLKVDFDIVEGEYKGFFSTDYRNNTSDKKKWRGSYRINIPNESNQYFESQQRSFNNFIGCLEETNNGFHWDWDETKLKGKGIGVLFRNKEYAIDNENGHFEGWSTECCAVTTANDIREGNFKMPKDKPLKDKNSTANTASSAFSTLGDDDGELPF